MVRYSKEGPFQEVMVSEHNAGDGGPCLSLSLRPNDLCSVVVH